MAKLKCDRKKERYFLFNVSIGIEKKLFNPMWAIPRLHSYMLFDEVTVMIYVVQDVYSASLLKQQSTDTQTYPVTHDSESTSLSHYALLLMLSNTFHCIIFDLGRSGINLCYFMLEVIILSLHNRDSFIIIIRGRRGRDRIVVGFTTTYAISAYHHWCCEFESRWERRVQHYVIKFVSDFSPVSSTIKTDHHDITEILLKVALNTIKQTI